MMSEMKSIREAFGGMREPRHSRNLRYPMIDVVALAVYGVLCGKTDFTTMADYLKLREAELTEAFGLTAGVPSHDVFYRNRWEIGTRSVIGPVGIAQRSRRVRISHRPYGQSFGHRMWPSARTHVCKYWYTR